MALLLGSISKGRLEVLNQGEFKHYSDCLAFIQCKPPTADCANRICEECRGIEPLLEELRDIMEDNQLTLCSTVSGSIQIVPTLKLMFYLLKTF